MKTFTYKNRKTGRTMVLDKPMRASEAKDYILVTQVRNGQMKAANISRK